MIDNPEQVARLLGKLRNSLPVAALARPSLKAIIRENSSSANPISQYTVTRVDYAGDEGGIVCHLAVDRDAGPEVFVVSITHLAFDPRLSAARDIAAYQKHRLKRLRRESPLEKRDDYVH